MKLLFCPHCGDIFNLSKEIKICSCGKTQGVYLKNGSDAVYDGGIPLGINNNSFLSAIYAEQELIGNKKELFEFTGFAISKSCNTFKEINMDK